MTTSDELARRRSVRHDLTEPSLVAAVIAEVEAERAALADTLHDEVLQSLLAARFGLELERRGGDALTGVRTAISEARERMWALRPRTTAGELVPALADLADRTGLVLDPGNVPAVVDVAAATVAYRAVQAVVDASPGARIRVTLGLKDGRLSVDVTGDGLTYGDQLAGWLRRAEQLGGRRGGSESSVWFDVPIEARKERAAL